MESYDGEISLSSQNYFFSRWNQVWNQGDTSQPNESFGKTHKAEKTELKYFPQSIKNSSVPHDQKEQRGHPQDSRNLFFLYRNPQKLKIAKNVLFLRKKTSKKFILNILFLGKSHSAEKTETGQLSQK